MDTLLDTYRDEDDESPPLNPNLTPIPTPDLHPIPPLLPDPKPDSIIVDSTDNNPEAAAPEPGPKAELITAENKAMPAELDSKPELMSVQLAENQTLEAEPELVSVQLAENRTISVETELIGENQTLASEPEPEPKSELMKVQLVENQTLSSEPELMSIQSAENQTLAAETEPKPELIDENQTLASELEPKSELMKVQLVENQTLSSETELMSVQSAENQTLAAETEPNPELIDENQTLASKSEPKSELMKAQLVDNQTLTDEAEPEFELMNVQLEENQTMLAEPELMSVQLAENQILADECEPKPVLIGGPEPSPVVESEPMVVELVENATPVTEPESETGKGELLGSEDISSDSISENVEHDEEEEEQEAEGSVPKKQKTKGHDDRLEELITTAKTTAENGIVNVNSNGVSSKKSSSKKKSKNNNVWTKSTSRKGKKKAKNVSGPPEAEDTVLITPIPRFPDKNDDSPEAKICLSKVYKAEKVELSEDRMSAGSCKGYRMVRATRGVSQGAWYFEIKVVHLGETGHTRLGWSLEKGDLQAPVGYDSNSFGYRDIDGSKIHKALRETYGEGGYKEGDVIGFYINLPEGDSYAPKPPHLVWYKGQKYVCAPDSKEGPPQTVPGSEISFFRNGVCQGVAFKDLLGGRYYPAASMYTLPDQPNCVVKFNFGPEFECVPDDFEYRPVPKPMIEVSYHGYDNRIGNGVLDENKQ